jgi:hypothetical protein
MTFAFFLCSRSIGKQSTPPPFHAEVSRITHDATKNKKKGEKKLEEKQMIP